MSSRAWPKEAAPEAAVNECPVCYYSMSDGPYDYNICSRCGTEFGNDDEVKSHEQLRREWINEGSVFFFLADKPEPATEGAPETAPKSDNHFLYAAEYAGVEFMQAAKVAVALSHKGWRTPASESKAEGAEKDIEAKRPTLHILFDGMARVYDRTEADELLDALESRNAEFQNDLAEVVFVYQCNKCAWMANREHLGTPCRCGGTCIRFATSVEAEHRAVRDSNRINDLASKLKEAEREVERLRQYRSWDRIHELETQLSTLTQRIEEIPLKVPAHVVVGKFDDEPFYLARDVEGYLRGVKE